MVLGEVEDAIPQVIPGGRTSRRCPGSQRPSSGGERPGGNLYGGPSLGLRSLSHRFLVLTELAVDLELDLL